MLAPGAGQPPLPPLPGHRVWHTDAVADHWTASGFPGALRREGDRSDRYREAIGRTGSQLSRWTTEANRAAEGLWVDLALYALSTVFALVTIRSNLPPHREWGTLAAGFYGAATGMVVIQVVWWSVYRRAPLRSRTILTLLTWLGTTLLPLVVEAVQRAAGQAGRAQDEVGVIEDGGRRLLESGTPYLGRAAIAARPLGEQLAGYLPYQPGMAVFGLPRAAATGWWTDARVVFALVTAVALGLALLLLRRAGMPRAALVRALQATTVLPLCALTLATGGDDLPVLALCLLAFALAATGRLSGSGVAVGLAAALKLFAWPVVVILAAHAFTQRRLRWYAIGAVGLPVLTLIPAVILDRHAVVENILWFPLGKGVVSSPAASPLPGHLIATYVPGGRIVTEILLLGAAAWVVFTLIRRPPRTAAAAARLAGWALLAAILLLPATRFGYLLYPVAFFVWSPALRPRAIPAPRAAPTAVPASS